MVRRSFFWNFARAASCACLAFLWLFGLVLDLEQPLAQEAPRRTTEGRMAIEAAQTGASGSGLESPSEPAPITVSMDFKDVSLKDVLKSFSQQTGINVIASEDVEDKALTLYLEEVAVLDALDQILGAADLLYERAPYSQIYIVKPKPEEPKVRTITRVYRLKFARVSTSRLARAAEALGSQTPFEAKQMSALFGTTSAGAGGAGGGGAGVSGAGLGAGGVGAGAVGGGAGEEVGVDKVIEELLTENGKVVVDERTNSLVVTDVPDNFPRVEAVLNVLDIRTAQILIEAELLETTLSKLKDLGIEWGQDSEGTLLKLTPATRTTRTPFSFFLGEKSSTATSISLGTIGTDQAQALLQALEQDTDTKILARPKVLTLDNESAVIRLTTNQAIGFQTSTGEQTQTRTVTPERVTTGIILVVTPQVNEEGFVTMLVEPSVAKVVSSQVTPPANTGTVKDPKTRSARAMVRIRQGETLVLGGLIDRSEEESLRSVPILSGIPFLGEAFKNKEISNTSSELIVFVTPRILAEPPSGSQVAAAPAPFALREQEETTSREQSIEEALKRLERPRL